MNRPERNHRNYISANRAPLASDPLNNSTGDAIDITNVKYYTKRTKKPIVNLKQYIRHYESIFHRPPPLHPILKTRLFRLHHLLTALRRVVAAHGSDHPGP